MSIHPQQAILDIIRDNFDSLKRTISLGAEVAEQEGLIRVADRYDEIKKALIHIENSAAYREIGKVLDSSLNR